MNNTISDFKAAKESVFNVVLAFYIKNAKKQYRLWIVKVKFHVFFEERIVQLILRLSFSYRST